MKVKDLEDFISKIQEINKIDLIIMIEDKANSLDDVCDDLIIDCVNNFMKELKEQLSGYLYELKDDEKEKPDE